MKTLRAFLVSFLGSRLAIGVAGVLFVAFAAQSVTAPQRLPPIGHIGLVELGVIPAPVVPQIDLLPSIIPAEIQKDLQTRAQEAAASAAPKAQRRIVDYLRAHPEVTRYVNYGATLASFLLLLLTFQLQTQTIKRHRRDVYAFVDGGFGT